MKKNYYEELAKMIRDKYRNYTFDEICMLHIKDIVKFFLKPGQKISGDLLREFTIREYTNFKRKEYFFLELDHPIEVRKKEYTHFRFHVDGKKAFFLYRGRIPIALLSIQEKHSGILCQQMQCPTWIPKDQLSNPVEYVKNNEYVRNFEWNKVLIVFLELYTLFYHKNKEIRIIRSENLNPLGASTPGVRLSEIYDKGPEEIGYEKRFMSQCRHKSPHSFYDL